MPEARIRGMETKEKETDLERQHREDQEKSVKAQAELQKKDAEARGIPQTQDSTPKH